MTLVEIEQELFASNPSYLANLGGTGLGNWLLSWRVLY